MDSDSAEQRRADQEPQPGRDPTGDVGSAANGRTRRSLRVRVIWVVGSIVLAAGIFLAWVVAANSLDPSHAGRVVFTTDIPTTNGAATCQLGNQVTTVTVGVPVYATYFYKARLSDQTVTMTVKKDGTPVYQNSVPPLDSNSVDCTEDPIDARTFGGVGAARYEFTLTIATGEVVSEGTLIIAAPTPRPSRRPVAATGHAGQVVFSTDVPAGESAATCKLGHEVASVPYGTTVYATYFYKKQLVDETVVVHLFYQGLAQSDTVLAPAKSNGVDCFEDPINLGIYPVGTVTIRLTTVTGEVVSEGTLIIEAPTSQPSRS